MGHELLPVTGTGLSALDSYKVTRALARIDGNGAVALASTQALARQQAAKIDAVAFVAERAQADVALLSQKEQQLAELVPAAVTRLQGITDMAAFAIADVLADTARRLR